MTKNTNLSPEEYRKILNGIEIKSISLKESKTYHNTEYKTPTDIKINIDTDSAFEVKENNHVFITQHYKFDARKPNSKSRYVQIDVKFLLILSSVENFTEDFFNIYKDISLRLNTWPYLREFINNTSLRMSIPPFTLPLFKA